MNDILNCVGDWTFLNDQIDYFWNDIKVILNDDNIFMFISLTNSI